MFMAETTKNVKELVNSIDKLEKEQIQPLPSEAGRFCCD